MNRRQVMKTLLLGALGTLLPWRRPRLEFVKREAFSDSMGLRTIQYIKMRVPRPDPFDVLEFRRPNEPLDRAVEEVLDEKGIPKKERPHHYVASRDHTDGHLYIYVFLK